MSLILRKGQQELHFTKNYRCTKKYVMKMLLAKSSYHIGSIYNRSCMSTFNFLYQEERETQKELLISRIKKDNFDPECEKTLAELDR